MQMHSCGSTYQISEDTPGGQAALPGQTCSGSRMTWSYPINGGVQLCVGWLLQRGLPESPQNSGCLCPAINTFYHPCRCISVAGVSIPDCWLQKKKKNSVRAMSPMPTSSVPLTLSQCLLSTNFFFFGNNFIKIKVTNHTSHPCVQSMLPKAF